MTHYILKGDIDHLRQYEQSAVATKNALRLTNTQNLPIADLYRTKPDGTVIHAMKRFDQEIVTVESAPPVFEPLEITKRNVATPPVFWTVESFYIVYDVVEPDLANLPTYTGEHLAGFYIPPNRDIEFETRIQGGPGYSPIDCIASPALDPNRALTPSEDVNFTKELDPITNTDVFTTETSLREHCTYYGHSSESGAFAVIASFVDTWGEIQLKINGQVFKTFSYHQFMNGSGTHIDSKSRAEGYPPPASASGTWGEWETGSTGTPTDERFGEAGVGSYKWFRGGAYDPETNSFICVWGEREVSRDSVPYTWYIGVGSMDTGVTEIPIVTDYAYDEGYRYYLYVKEGKIYNTHLGLFFFLSVLILDDYTELYQQRYYVFRTDSQGNLKKYERFIDLGTDITAHYYHMEQDKKGNSWPCGRTFRLVRKTSGQTAQGEFMSANPADELEYDADVIEVGEGQGY